MSLVGTVESLWRYPVKSMRGEELDEAFFGFSGMYGDRLFAFRSTAAPKGFPFLTGREQEEMLLYRPRFRHPERAGKPPNLSEAESMAPSINPLFADAADLAVDVETPTGELLPVEDPRLMNLLPKRTGAGNVLTLLRSERAMTDCRPISLFSIQTARQLGEEIGTTIDKRRFRTNILYGSRFCRGIRRGCLCRPNLTHRTEGGDFSARARSLTYLLGTSPQRGNTNV